MTRPPGSPRLVLASQSPARLATLRSRGATVLYVYALNTPGTGGTDTLLGTLPVTIG